ncbi:MAG: hypothetical protein LH660_21715 [Phormidesmis sp. CAN_BIN36]|nr:hypothetical protein [Phormidesmis sp. CAN_BIN36]
MSNFNVSSPSEENSHPLAETQVWDSLKRAIAESSGFNGWKTEREVDKRLADISLDTLVHTYLRETLETLAY